MNKLHEFFSLFVTLSDFLLNSCLKLVGTPGTSLAISLMILGRATMTTTTLLTLTAMFGAVRSNVPRVSYISLLDVWMFVCIVFVFLVIIHFVAVISLLRYNRKSTAETLEYYGIVGIPFLFLIFNVVYWYTLVNTWWHQNHD